MVAGAPQRLAAPAGAEPASGGENKQDLLVGAPRQGSRGLLRSRPGSTRDCPSYRDIRLRRPDGKRKAWPGATATCLNCSCCAHGSKDRKSNNLSTRHLPPGSPFCKLRPGSFLSGVLGLTAAAGRAVEGVAALQEPFQRAVVFS